MGHYNRNYVMRLPTRIAERSGVPADSLVKFRVRRTEANTCDLRIWQREEELLYLAAGRIGPVPRVLLSRPAFSVHTYAVGCTLEAVAPAGERVETGCLRQIFRLFRRMASVRRGDLPPCPAGWPEEGDCTGFAAALSGFTHAGVYLTNRGAYGGLYDRLGLSEDVVSRFADQGGTLHPRPFALLHGDLHRENLVVQPSGRLCVIDWELALYGDPLYDLATHLWLMRYPKPDQWSAVIQLWREAVEQARPGLSAGWERDLERYLDCKRVHSAVTDVVRAADSLCHGSLDRAAVAARRAVALARRPLGLRAVPSLEETAAALLAWRREHEPAMAV